MRQVVTPISNLPEGQGAGLFSLGVGHSETGALTGVWHPCGHPNPKTVVAAATPARRGNESPLQIPQPQRSNHRTIEPSNHRTIEPSVSRDRRARSAYAAKNGVRIRTDSSVKIETSHCCCPGYQYPCSAKRRVRIRTDRSQEIGPSPLRCRCPCSAKNVFEFELTVRRRSGRCLGSADAHSPQENEFEFELTEPAASAVPMLRKKTSSNSN